LGFTALKELTDEAIHNERALVESVPIPVLVHVPVLNSRRERVQAHLNHLTEATATLVLFAASVAMGVYTYLAG
jgi:hypothetical protein